MLQPKAISCSSNLCSWWTSWQEIESPTPKNSIGNKKRIIQGRSKLGATEFAYDFGNFGGADRKTAPKKFIPLC